MKSEKPKARKNKKVLWVRIGQARRANRYTNLVIFYF